MPTRPLPSDCLPCASTLVALAALAATPAIAQPDIPLSGDELPALVEVIPNELPGHDPGPRRRPTPPPAETVAPDASEAQDPEPEPQWWWQWDRATGNWWGARTALEDFGITLSGSYTMDFASNVSGGRRTQSNYLHLLDFNVTFDLEKLVGLSGAQVFADYYSISGDGISEDAGDFQGVSNIESGNVDQLAELWYEQVLFDGVLRFKLGKVDAFTEFAFIDAASEFINTSAGYTPTLFVLPSYPDPATSVNVFLYPVDGFYAGFGLYDGATQEGINTGGRGPATFFSDDNADSWHLIGEAGVTWESLGPLHAGRLAAGAWGHTGEFERFDGGTDDGTAGFYAHVESMVWKRTSEDPDDERGLSAFAQFGYADDQVSDVGLHLGAGLSLLGTFDARPDDATGVYVSWVDLSDEPGAGYEEDETAVEWFYKIQATPFLAVRPDVQLVFNPSGDRDLDTAVVLTLRVSVDF